MTMKKEARQGLREHGGRQGMDEKVDNSLCQTTCTVNPQLSGPAQNIVAAFKAMYPEPDELKKDGKPLWITLWSAPQKESIHIPVFRSEAIPGAVKNWIGRRHVYFAPGLRCANLGRWKAGGNKDVTAIPGLWTEVDIQGPGHVEQALPASLDEALELAYSIPELPPSLIIHSGGGIYPFWLFKEVWMLESKAEQEEAQALLKRFEQTILKHGSTKGWNLDSVADLRRVLRLPGSLNIKDPDNPKQVKILEYHPERRYNPSDFEPYLAEPETTVIHGSLPDDEDFQPADIEKILSICPWMKHCQVDAQHIKEPEWYAMLSVVARCKDPEHWAHELSKPYPGYSEAETAKKFQQSKDRAGPVTCERVRKKLNPDACEGCPHQVSSPILLGREQKPKNKDGIPQGFSLNDKGVYRAEEDKDGNVENVWTCSPLKVTALTRDGENSEWGRLLQIKDPDVNWHEWAMPMSMLAGSGEEYRKILLSFGLIMAPGKKARDALHYYLSSCRPGTRARCVHRIGWHGRQYVLPTDVIGKNGDERPVLQGQVAGNPFRTKGSLGDWQQYVGQLCVGNSRLLLAVSAALAGPILELAGAENGGIHFYGPSSSGKTTVLQAASSVLGGGGVRGFIQNWRTTDNGLEAVAAKHCDATLFLDELGQADARVAGSTAYMLANGMGKQRAKRDGSQREPQEWRLFFVSTGEITLSDKVREDQRKKVMAGQQVRILDIPADAGAETGIFDTIHGFQNGDRFARHLKDAAAQYYGTPFREFLEHIVRDRDTLGADIRLSIEAFVDNTTSSGTAPQAKRAASRFGLLASAGELGIFYGVLPWPEGAAIEAAERCFHDWLMARGGDQDAEERAALEQTMAYFERYGSSRFQDLSSDHHVPVYRAGFVQKTPGSVDYLVLPSCLDEICNGLPKMTVLKALEKHGILQRDCDGKRQTKKTLPGLGRCRIYVMSLKNTGDTGGTGGI